MAGTGLATIEELGTLPPPPPARPRVLLVATVIASGAVAVAFASMLGVYLHERAAVRGAGRTWFEDGAVPLTPGNMSLVGFAISMVTIQWAVQAIGNDDRRHTWLAFGATIMVGAMHMVGMAFLYSQTGFEVATLQGGLFFAITGGHLVLLGAAMVFAALMAFRTLGGQYSAKDREGVVAAAVFWHTTAIVYAAIWYAILVVK